MKGTPQRRGYEPRVSTWGSYVRVSTPLDGGGQRLEDGPAARLFKAICSPWAEVRPLDLEENSIVAWFADAEATICFAAGQEGEPWISVDAVGTCNSSRKLLKVAFGDGCRQFAHVREVQVHRGRGDARPSGDRAQRKLSRITRLSEDLASSIEDLGP